MVNIKMYRIKVGCDRRWHPDIGRPRKAMLIGVRTLSDGYMYKGLYHQKSYFKAYMFVSDSDQKPFFALPEHCEFMSNWQSGGTV